MSNKVFYHTRQNKAVDRNLFVQTLHSLREALPISSYKYIGFGSYYFDDFRMLHNSLNISSMLSLERDGNEFRRAIYNKPFKCIELDNVSSSEYISKMEEQTNTKGIYWLDYSAANELRYQLDDLTSILPKLEDLSILRVTLNGNPTSLGGSPISVEAGGYDDIQEYRLDMLKKLVDEEYLPANISANNITHKEYPQTLLRILNSVVVKTMGTQNVISSSYMLPLFSTIYADDGHNMVTATGVIVERADEARIRKALSDREYINFDWREPNRISIPPLTVKEILALNLCLPDEDVEEALATEFPFIFPDKDDEQLASYVKYYKYYPSFHLVSF